MNPKQIQKILDALVLEESVLCFNLSSLYKDLAAKKRELFKLQRLIKILKKRLKNEKDDFISLDTPFVDDWDLFC